MKHILEVGSSDLLNHDYGNDIIITKTSRNLSRLSQDDKLIPFNSDDYLNFYKLNSDSLLLSHIFSRIDENKLDLIVFSLGNNGKRQLFHEESIDEFRLVNNTNYLSVVYLMKKILSYISTKNKNCKLSFLFVASVAVTEGYPYHTSYSTSKSALASLSKNLTKEYNEDYPQLKFDTIYPGMISTRLSHHRGEDSKVYFTEVLLPKINQLLK